MASATPDLRLPSQPQGITTHWLVSNILLGVRGPCVLTTWPGLHSRARGRDSNPRPVDRNSSIPTNRPPSHTVLKYTFTKCILMSLSAMRGKTVYGDQWGGRDQKFCFLCSCPCGLVLLQAGWHSRDVPTDSVQSSNIELIIIDVYKSFAACSNQMVHSLMASLS